MDDFVTQVVEMTYRLANVRIPSADAGTVPDYYDTLTDAILEFYRKYASDPGLFLTPADAVNWVFKVVGNKNRWASAEPTLDLKDWDVTPVVAPMAAEPDPLIPQPETVASMTVILEYFARPDVRHTGRLTLTQDEVNVIEKIAEYGLSDASASVPPQAYQLISEVLRVPVDKIQDTYYKSRATAAEILYVIGGLGPAGALASVPTLAAAIDDFHDGFRGQADWSILRFAARSAIPYRTYARVDAKLYTESIEREYRNASPDARTPNQAERLGWTPGGPRPTQLLHAVESRAARALNSPHPHCVLCGCELHTPRGPQ